MKSQTWDEGLLREHRAYLREDAAKQAFNTLVERAIALRDLATTPGWHGDIREFTYSDQASGERPFAFIVNREHLLFYVRSNGRNQVPGGFEGLRSQFGSARETSEGEWTVRIASKDDATRLNALLLGQREPPQDGNDGIREAESIISTVLPDSTVRRAVLEQLINSAEAAESIAPAAWGGTLFKDGFRLNVGQVEVLILGQNTFRLNLLGKIGEHPFIGPLFVDGHYRSISGDKCAFVGTPAQFLSERSILESAHLGFIRRAATKQSGDPIAGSRHRVSHSEGLMAYAYAEIGRVRLYDGLAVNIGIEMSFPNELDRGLRYVEGARKQVWVNAFERDPAARQACLAHYGYNCAVCNFNFADRYGSIGKEFIHVHHLKPMALTDGEYELNPVADLRPVCPNCHAMLHRGENLLSINELRGLLKQG